MGLTHTQKRKLAQIRANEHLNDYIKTWLWKDQIPELHLRYLLHIHNNTPAQNRITFIVQNQLYELDYDVDLWRKTENQWAKAQRYT